MKIPVEIATLSTLSIIKASNDKKRKLEWNIASANECSAQWQQTFQLLLDC